METLIEDGAPPVCKLVLLDSTNLDLVRKPAPTVEREYRQRDCAHLSAKTLAMTSKPTPTNADSPSRQMRSVEPIMRVHGQVHRSVQKEEMTAAPQLLLQCANSCYSNVPTAVVAINVPTAVIAMCTTKRARTHELV